MGHCQVVPSAVVARVPPPLSELKRNYPLLLKFSIELVGAAAEVAGLVVPRLVQQLRTLRTQREEL